jgi:hypothetical protein
MGVGALLVAGPDHTYETVQAQVIERRVLAEIRSARVLEKTLAPPDGGKPDLNLQSHREIGGIPP